MEVSVRNDILNVICHIYLFIYSLSLQDKGSNSYSVPFLMPFKALTVLWLIPDF